MIFVTRPSPYGEELTEILNQAGYLAKHLPLFEIQACLTRSQLENAFARLKPKDSVVFTSPQLADILFSFRYNLPDFLHYFAVGSGTVKRFKQTQALLGNQSVEITFPSQQDSEGLIALFESTIPASEFINKTFLVLKGKQSRDAIQNYLQKKQAQVNDLICYERKMIPDPFNAIELNLFNELQDNNLQNKDSQDKNGFIATSCEHLQRLSDLLTLKQKRTAFIIVIHEKQRKLALSLGWQSVYLASSDQTLTLAILNQLEPIYSNDFSCRSI